MNSRFLTAFLLLVLSTVVVSAQQAAGDAINAVSRSDLAALRSVIASGFDLNFRYGRVSPQFDGNGKTLLLVAVYIRKTKEVQLLLNEGADVNAQDNAGNTALSLAAENNDVELVKVLLAAHPNPNLRASNGLSAAEAAAILGYRQCLEILREAGVPYESNLSFAAALGDITEIKALIAKGADVNAPRTPTSFVPLALAARENQLEAMRLLISSGAKVDAVGATTPLVLAAGWNRLDAVKLLLEAGANPDLASESGLYPLANVARVGFTEIARLLVERGANPKGVGTKFSPIHEAARNDQPEIIELLLTKGADINATKDGWTPLMMAAAENKPFATQLLLQKGARVGMKVKTQTDGPYVGINGERGKVEREFTALQLAESNGNDAILEIFKNPDLPLKRQRTDFTKSKDVSVKDWTKKYADFDPRQGRIGRVSAFKQTFGEPTQITELDHKVIWTYRCKDGLVRIQLGDPRFTGDQLLIEDFTSSSIPENDSQSTDTPRSETPSSPADNPTAKAKPTKRPSPTAAKPKQDSAATVAPVSVTQSTKPRAATTETSDALSADLFFALSGKNWDAAKKLVERGANLDGSITGKPLLQVMVEAKNTEAVKWMLANGANRNVKDKSGRTILEALQRRLALASPDDPIREVAKLLQDP